MAEDKNKIRIGITQGDINGVGVEVIIKSLANREILDIFTPVIFGNKEIFQNCASELSCEDFEINEINDIKEIADGRINLIEVNDRTPSRTPGVASEEGGKAAVDALEAASKAVENGEIDLIVTAPIDKNSIQSENFHFPGHTEFLESKFVVEGGRALMIMVAGKLRVSLVTTHMPLREVPEHITEENIIESIKAFNRSLKMDFGCERPKIAVLSLNPHCGDNGVLGTEEENIIIPALEKCRGEGILSFGPISADGFFGSGAYANFDGVLAMYHDQGLAPFKVIAGGRGINFTAGLNIIRTSPAHGTAYDKAGKGTANEMSMREAFYEAIDIARRRDSYLDASENPLEIHSTQQKGGKRQKDKQTDSEPIQTED